LDFDYHASFETTSPELRTATQRAVALLLFAIGPACLLQCVLKFPSPAMDPDCANARSGL